ncbi:hypothetical protein DFH07DRAFT_965712 [Mycena maculata]|uniref:Uncharacterized protein n=1 Tax=Mycena maculata TaxID=230809 RepID=A0AAD7ICV0_9AGAR|nr:hypothetical protein DFH07DRAFT_965712 [Mycena maculata]
MLRALTLIPLLLRVLAQSVTNDTTSPIWNTLPPNGTVPGTSQSVSYQWIAFAAATQNECYFVKSSCTALIAEDSGDDVMDIMQIQMQQSGSFNYYFRPSTPPGNYHVRLNGTVWSLQEATPTSINDLVLDAPLFNATTRTPTFSVAAAASSAFPCATPAFTPVRSLSDPAYAPVRVTGPTEGSVVPLVSTSIAGGEQTWDHLIDVGFMPMDTDTYYDGPLLVYAPVGLSLELVNSDTGASAGVVHEARAFYFENSFTWSDANGGNFMDVSNFTISPGGWMIRANYTWMTGKISTLSSVFYIASALPCVGIGNSTTPGSASTGTGASPTNSPTAHAGASGTRRLVHSAAWGSNVWVLALVVASAMRL